jgi:hypothetical protein
MSCYHCDKTARSPVRKLCRSAGGVEFTADLHEACIAGYARSLKQYGSRMADA